MRYIYFLVLLSGSFYFPQPSQCQLQTSKRFHNPWFLKPGPEPGDIQQREVRSWKSDDDVIQSVLDPSDNEFESMLNRRPDSSLDELTSVYPESENGQLERVPLFKEIGGRDGSGFDADGDINNNGKWYSTVSNGELRGVDHQKPSLTNGGAWFLNRRLARNNHKMKYLRDFGINPSQKRSFLNNNLWFIRNAELKFKNRNVRGQDHQDVFARAMVPTRQRRDGRVPNFKAWVTSPVEPLRPHDRFFQLGFSPGNLKSKQMSTQQMLAKWKRSRQNYVAGAFGTYSKFNLRFARDTSLY